MKLTVTTWNINSVRLRIDNVAKFIMATRPDVLCLQETKCPDDAFPLKRFRRLGYEHIALNGQKGYHGVAIISRLPFDHTSSRGYCGKTDSRHVDVTLGEKAGLKDPLKIHNFYVPAGGDEPDRTINPKFGHKLDFIEEMKQLKANGETNTSAILVGDLNIAPLEHDVWSHKQLLKIVSHTPIETEALDALLTGNHGWTDLVRKHLPYGQKLSSWWSYRALDWQASNRGRRLDHIWATADIAAQTTAAEIVTMARGWTKKPSDHVPVIAHF